MNDSTLSHQTKLDQDTLEIYSIAYGIENICNIEYNDEIACANEYNKNTLQDIQNSIIL
jgi:hypothetical protein